MDNNTSFEIFLKPRLEAIHKMMMAGFYGSGELSSASKGHERELFVNTFLSQIFPPNYRFGSGDIIDGHTKKSGQVDIVIEYANFMSFPYLFGGPRLYLAEGVAAAIETKSNLGGQWDEALATATKIKELKRIFIPDRDKELALMLDRSGAYARALGHPGTSPQPVYETQSYSSLIVNEKYPPQQIPVFIVGYKGWQNEGTLGEKLRSADGVVDAILTLEPLMYRCRRGASSQGFAALFQFIDGLFHYVQKNFMQAPMNDIYFMPRNLYEQFSNV
ncbi:DUF6602 domain-containing protein [Achromobacter sp. HZ01]|uniref:DUF6602 domain-containing protein n=1 Tax=Achromobacter sp. HZ01 TaxID=1416886 RepID=UPI0011BEEA51|nr:DUF6602 domain-containing protein [Achromobacter sp. HZ01]